MSAVVETLISIERDCKLRPSLWTHAFQHTGYWDLGVHALGGWIPAPVTHPACTVPRVWLLEWWLSVHIYQNLTYIVTPRVFVEDQKESLHSEVTGAWECPHRWTDCLKTLKLIRRQQWICYVTSTCSKPYEFHAISCKYFMLYHLNITGMGIISCLLWPQTFPPPPSLPSPSPTCTPTHTLHKMCTLS